MAFDISKIPGFNPQLCTFKQGDVGTPAFKCGQTAIPLTTKQSEPSNGVNWHSLDKFDYKPPVISGSTSNIGNKLDYFT